jgi:hypothetical protein
MNKNGGEVFWQDEYYDTLIELFVEPDFLEKFLRACVKAYALNTEQLQALEGCAEEAREHLKKHDRYDFDCHTSFDAWQKWHDDALSNITRSIALLCEYGAEETQS